MGKEGSKGTRRVLRALPFPRLHTLVSGRWQCQTQAALRTNGAPEAISQETNGLEVSMPSACMQAGLDMEGDWMLEAGGRD